MAKGEEQVATDVRNTGLASGTYRESRRDDFLGKIVMFTVAVLIFGVVAFFACIAYRMAGSNSTEGASITSITDGSQIATDAKEVEKAEEAPMKEKMIEDATFKKDSVSISVLNGGAPKGSAAIIADILKADGFLKVTTGNSSADHSGLVVYRKEGNEDAAEAVKKALSVKYPSVIVKAADAKSGETSAAPVVIVFGK
jgi:predicted lipoprotein with Yx(FWY)xxD motif